jgi:hypothetical protein
MSVIRSQAAIVLSVPDRHVLLIHLRLLPHGCHAAAACMRANSALLRRLGEHIPDSQVAS